MITLSNMYLFCLYLKVETLITPIPPWTPPTRRNGSSPAQTQYEWHTIIFNIVIIITVFKMIVK